MADVVAEATATFESADIALTKLVPPRLRAETVERADLVARRLNSSARLGVIAGPAGSGKSTLLAQCHAADTSSVWLSLGPADNDPAVLWSSIIAALRSQIPQFADVYLARLRAAGRSAIDDVVVSVCNELAERGAQIHLLLDDVHLVQDPIGRQSLHHFVSTLPDGVQITVASRSSDPFPLARLRAAGDLVEVDAAALALSSRAAHQLLASFDVELDQEHLDLLVARTEGWPAGLQLVGLAITEADDAPAFVEELSGTESDIATYLLNEVLGSLSGHERDFMIETSMLDRLNGRLCDAVTARSGGATMLDRLEHANAFVIPLDRNGTWYRYHHLFRDLLAAELQRTRPEDVQQLHGRAFRWLRDDGQVVAAIPHGLAAGETAEAADLLCRHWLVIMSTGRNETALRLIDAFPPDFVGAHQPLAIAAGSIRVMTGDQAGALHWLDAAERAPHDGPRPDGMANRESSIALLRGAMAPLGVDAALADGRTALRLEPQGSPWYGLAHLIVGRSLIMRGEPDAAQAHLEEIERVGDMNPWGYAVAELALSELRRGDPETALAKADAARHHLRNSGATDVFMAAIAEAAAALASIALGDERSARTALRAARRPMEVVGRAMPLDSTHTRLLLARVALELGEAELARGYLGDAKRVIDSIDDVGVMRAEHARLAASLDDQQPIAEPAGAVDFTDRELQVIALLPSPLTIREMADEMFVSWNTAKTYVRRVYRKLNASSREEAVLIADELGLIPDATTPPGR